MARSVYDYHGCGAAVVDTIWMNGIGSILANRDHRGFFGSGFYSSLNIELAARYVSQSLPVGGLVPVVMFAAWIGAAYPIWQQPLPRLRLLAGPFTALGLLRRAIRAWI